MEEKEISVTVYMYDDTKESFQKLKQACDDYESRYFSITDCYRSDKKEQALIEITGDGVEEQCDILDHYSPEGVHPGYVITYERAQGEVKAFLKTLYLKDVIADWEMEDFPDDRVTDDAA